MNGEDRGGSEGEGERSTPPTLRHTSLDDDLFRALAATQRRRILAVLLDASAIPFEELLDVLTGWAAVADDDGVGTVPDRERIAVTVYHAHLPILVEADLAAYDEATREVALADLDPAIRDLLDYLFEDRNGERS